MGYIHCYMYICNIMSKNKAVSVHVLVWVVLLAVLYLVNVRERPADASILILGYGALNIGIFYVHYFFLNPLLIGDIRYWCAITYMSVVLVISICVKYGIASYYQDIILQYCDAENKEKILTLIQVTILALVNCLFFSLQC